MRTGVRLGIDVGKVRIGVASSDPNGMIATPVSTVPRGDGDIAAIMVEASERSVVEIVIGLPLALSGGDSASTQDARDFAQRVAAAGDIPVRMVDERLSTVSATRALRASGRNSRTSRPVIDQVAAVIILQHALDAERTGGRLPGVVVVPHEGR
ncbi:Holliday junction resolvase RuvX [Lacisediminihabitans sp. H27-G8]|uniref:Holliday junction resolvase RuvX n=1 Tax=Lacisediminihabitans sp. H27-G8 TaxID=3111909 RepID=UPI0038FBF2F2